MSETKILQDVEISFNSLEAFIGEAKNLGQKPLFIYCYNPSDGSSSMLCKYTADFTISLLNQLIEDIKTQNINSQPIKFHP